MGCLSIYSGPLSLHPSFIVFSMQILYVSLSVCLSIFFAMVITSIVFNISFPMFVVGIEMRLIFVF